jgi:hypothetical protein
MLLASHFFKLSYSDKLLFLEACYFMLEAKLMIRLVPMKKYLPRLGILQSETSWKDPTACHPIIFKVSQAILRNRKWMHLKNRCYPEAIAAKKMLRRRGLPSTLYIGVGKTNGKITAHAWLRCGSFYVIGKREMDKFAVVSTCA